jgi:hypothetical protein
MKFLIWVIVSFGAILCFGGCVREAELDKASLPPVRLSASVSQTQPALSQKFEFRIRLDHLSHISNLEIPEVGDKIRGLRILEPLLLPTSIVGERVYKERSYALMGDQLGAFILPSVEITFNIDGKQSKVETARLFVEVVEGGGEAGQAEDILDIAGMIEVPFERMYSGFWVVALLGVVLGLVVFLVYRSRRIEVIEEVITAHEWAEEALVLLDKNDFLSQGKFKSFYQELSRILRGYIKRRFFIASEETTVEELLPLIGGIQELSLEQIESLGFFFREAELAKFAEIYRPHFEICQSRNWVGEFILQTHLEEEEEPVNFEGNELNHESVA